MVSKLGKEPVVLKRVDYLDDHKDNINKKWLPDLLAAIFIITKLYLKISPSLLFNSSPRIFLAIIFPVGSIKKF